MEITLKEIEKKLQDLSPELLIQINEYIEFLKVQYSQNGIPQWQKDEIQRRKMEMERHPENTVNEEEMNYFLDDLGNES